MLASGCAALLLTACATRSGPSGPSDPFARTELTPPALGTTPAGSVAALPLDAYVDNSPADGNLLIEVNGLLTQQCMKGKGFSYRPATPSGTASTAPAPVYGITDLRQATSYGYGGAPSGTGKASGVPSITQQLAVHGAGWVIALYGGNYDGQHPAAALGCVDSAADPLYESAYGTIDRSIVGELGSDALNRTEADPRIVALFQAWSSCMSARGFNYPDPMHAAGQRWPALASATERATAVADVRCKQSTDLARIFSTADAGYQQQLIAQNKAALDAFQAGYRKLIEQSELELAKLTGPG